jgi:hypothetical protein
MWFERSVREIGHRPGFYDFATNEAGFEPADVTFCQLENGFPQVRTQIESDFDSWQDHLGFLLRFAQMMRARSLLFFEQQKEALSNTPTWIVKEVLDNKTLKLESMDPVPPGKGFIQNRSLLEMQDQIRKGAAWANDYTWALRYTESPKEPFIVSESPFISTEIKDKRPFMLILPISWRACLFGTLENFGQVKTDRVDADYLRELRATYRKGATEYLVSPIKLDRL